MLLIYAGECLNERVEWRWVRATRAEGPKQPCLHVRGGKGNNRLPFLQKKEMLNTTFKSLVLKLLLLKHDGCTSPTYSNLFKVQAFYKVSWYQKKRSRITHNFPPYTLARHFWRRLFKTNNNLCWLLSTTPALANMAREPMDNHFYKLQGRKNPWHKVALKVFSCIWCP